MKQNKYYTSGAFAKKAGVTIRTIRYYDKMDLLKPSKLSDTGFRYYTDEDLVKLQQILLYKYLGFSLDEIKEMTVASADPEYLLESLRIQKKLLEERAEEIQDMETTITETCEAIENHRLIDWNRMVDLIHLSAAERSLKTQYLNSTNISARIRLHSEYSVNKQGWFPWIMEQLDLKPGMKVLEVGCGNGALWNGKEEKTPSGCSIVLSDISEGMINDLRRTMRRDDRFTYQVFDCSHIPYPDNTFDLVIANHVLFYCEDIPAVIHELHRVLKPGGRLITSTYGKNHMKEITQLAQQFNPEIVLSTGEKLYERFGIENGEELLRQSFSNVECRMYEDAIEINQAEPIIAYILSCHGNQNQLLLNDYKAFKVFVEKKVRNGFHITKEAGIFISS